MSDARNRADADLLHGAAAIAEHLSLSRARVYHLHASKALPTFQMGAIVCARRSTLAKHFAEQEAKAAGGKDG